MRVGGAVIGFVLGLLATQASLAQAAPSAANSTCPTAVNFGTNGTCCFDVIVRDALNNPVSGSQVTIDMASCGPIIFCGSQPPGLIVNPAANSARTTTNASGVAHFCICATSPAPGGCPVTIQADGVLLCTVPLATVRGCISITSTAGSGGTISPIGAVAVNQGSNQSFTITPDASHSIASVTVDGVSQGAVASYTFTNVQANHTIAASFQVLPANVHITASAGSGAFAPRTDFAIGAVPLSVAVGDVNGDGKPDVATPNGSGSAVSVSLGNGSGGFGAKTDFPTGGSPAGVALADVSGDGKLDLVVANQGSNTVSVLLGNGAGSFGAKTDYATGALPIAVAVADLNADGNPDLVVTNYNANTVSVLLATGPGVFGAKTDYATGSSPAAVVVRDVSGDGKPDLVVANFFSDAVSVLLGTGTGTFGAKTDYATGQNPHGVAVGDFNGDGRPDLAAANSNVSTVSVLLGTGGGVFGAKTDYPAGARPYGIATADLNGDRKLDLAVVAGNANALTVLLGDGAGGFSSRADFTTGVDPSAVAIADVSGDGVSDLIVVDHGVSAFSVLLGVGGTIAPPGVTTLAFNGSRSYTITAGVGSSIANVRVDGVPQGAITSYSFTNVTSDRTIDAAFAAATHTITASANAGGTVTPSGATAVVFGASQLYVITPNAGFFVADVLVDGVSQGANLGGYQFDAVTSNHTLAVTFHVDYQISASAGGGGSIAPSGVTLLAGGASQAYTISPNVGFLIGNLTVDGVSQGPLATYTFTNVQADHTIAASFQTGVTITASISGPGTISPSGTTTLPVGGNITYTINANPGFVISDVLIDGVSVGPVASYTFTNVTASHTIAVAFLVGALRITASAGSGTFGTNTEFVTGSVPAAVAVGDVSGDGKQDLAIADQSSSRVSVLLGDGTGSFGAKTDFVTGNSPSAVALADLNSDGSADLVVANQGSNSVSVLLGSGGGSFGARTDFTTGSSPVALAMADFNGDTRPDVAVADQSSARVSVLLGNGSGGFGAKTDFITGTQPSALVIADVSGDGKLDLLLANRSSNTVSVLLGNGSGGFGAKTDFATATQPVGLGVGDVNGDGKLDVVSVNLGINTVSVLLGNGIGGFGPKTDLSLGTPASGMLLTDVNVDGKLDLVLTTGSNSVAVALGNGAGGFGATVNFTTGGGQGSLALADVNGDGTSDLLVANRSSNNVSVLPGLGGTIVPPGITAFGSGANQTYTITPSTGYGLAGVIVDGVSQGFVHTYPFTNIIANHTIAASFVASNVSAANSTVPDIVTIGADGTCCFDVVVRDLFNNPVPGATIIVDFGGCPIGFCTSQPPGVTIDPLLHTARVFADGSGRANVCICAASLGGACPASVFANGVLLGGNLVAKVCAPDSICVPGAWSQVASGGPSARYGHAMASNTNHYQVVLFGGMGAGSTLLGDTWVWNGVTWNQKFPSHHPTARSGHAMAYDFFRDRVVLFGGTDGSGDQGDTWEWDGTDWTLVSSSGPSARALHAMAYDFDRKHTVLYGGSPLLADMWIWDGVNWVQACTSCPPGPRERATMAYDVGRGRTFLFGGVNAGGADVSQWVWDDVNWAHVPSGSPLPIPATARDQSMTYANSCNSVVLFGGETGGDTWSWSGAKWFRVPTAITPRARYAMAYDLFQDRPLIFGGYNPALGPNSLASGTWEWCSPCNTPLLPTDSLGNGIYPSDDGPTADADTAVTITSGLVSAVYPGFDTSTNAWLSKYPCDFGFGGDEDPADEDENPQAELDSLGIAMTPAALQDSLTAWNAQIGATYASQPHTPLGAVGLPYVYPATPHCPDRSAPHKYVFGGRDIIFIHGFRTTPLAAAVLGGPNDSARVGWQAATHFPGSLENPGFYENGYWKMGAEKYWREHIKHFLTQRGFHNRYLIVAWPVTQRLDVGIQCALTQIADAMQYGTGVVDPSGHHDCANFGTPDYVVVSHSTGGLLTGSMMAAAKDHTHFPNLNADYVADLCKGEVALNGAISGSNEALALVKLAILANPLVESPTLDALCRIVNTQYPELHLPCDALADIDLSYVLNGVSVDLCPAVAVGRWGPFQNASPIRTVTMAGGHPTTNGADQSLWISKKTLAQLAKGLIKHHILNGFDDAVVENQNACADPEPYTTAYAYWGRKRDVKDKGLKYFNMNDRAKGYFRDQWKDKIDGPDGSSGPGFHLVAIGANDGVSPWGMVQPDHDAASSISVSPAFGDPYNLTGHDPSARYHNHFSFMESASDHYGTTPGFDAAPPFMGLNQELYEWTTPDTPTQPNGEETIAVTDDHIYDPFNMTPYPDGAAMVKKDQPGEDVDVIGVPKKHKKNGKVAYKWQRTYHRAHGWQTKALGDFMYEFVLTDPPGASCTPVCCVRPPSGLLAWWPGELDASIAGQARELVAPKAPGVLTGGAYISTGKVETAFRFDGVNDHVQVASKPKLDLGNDFTIQAWVYTYDDSTTSKVILDKFGASGGVGYGLRLFHDRPALRLATSTSCTSFLYANESPLLADSCWHHIVATKQGANARIYVDGAIVGDFTNACVGSFANPAPVEIGGLPLFNTTFFTGMIDEVAMWSRALSPAEVRALWASGSEGMCRQSWWVPSVVLAQSGLAHIKPVICNFDQTALPAHFSFVSVPQGGTCTAPGPTGFSPAFGGQNITSGSCVMFPVVTITCPPGMGFGSSSCYKMQAYFREGEAPACYQIANGRVVRGLSIWDVGGAADAVLLSPSDLMTATAQAGFDVRNLSATAQALPYRLSLVPTNGDTTGMATIRLNGLPPGTPVNGVVNVPANGTTRVNVTIDASNLVLDRFYDVVFSYDMDGDNQPDAAAAVGLGDFEDLPSVGVGPGTTPNFETLRWIRVTPNPFTESSSIEFELARPGEVEIQVFDIVGRRVRDLSRNVAAAGRQAVIWDGRDDAGHVNGSGMYMVRIRFDGRTSKTKMLMVRQR